MRKPRRSISIYPLLSWQFEIIIFHNLLSYTSILNIFLLFIYNYLTFTNSGRESQTSNLITGIWMTKYQKKIGRLRSVTLHRNKIILERSGKKKTYRSVMRQTGGTRLAHIPRSWWGNTLQMWRRQDLKLQESCSYFNQSETDAQRLKVRG